MNANCGDANYTNWNDFVVNGNVRSLPRSQWDVDNMESSLVPDTSDIPSYGSYDRHQLFQRWELQQHIVHSIGVDSDIDVIREPLQADSHNNWHHRLLRDIDFVVMEASFRT